MVEWPQWWHYEVELTPHLHKRMLDRAFNEAEIRVMLEDAIGYHADVEPGRWVIQTIHDRRPWDIIVEPIESEKTLLIVTAYERAEP